MTNVPHLRVRRPLHRRAGCTRSLLGDVARHPRLRPSAHRLLARRLRGRAPTITRRGLAELPTLPVTNDDDRLGAATSSPNASRPRCMAHDTGEWQRSVRAIASPRQRAARHVRPDVAATARRRGPTSPRGCTLVPAALDGLRATYEPGRADGRVAARRQALAAADQAGTWAGNRWFDSPRHGGGRERRRCPPTLVAAVRDGADAANTAYAGFADYLRDLVRTERRRRRRLRAGALRGGRAPDAGRRLRPRRRCTTWAWDRLPPTARRDPHDVRADPAGRRLRRGDPPARPRSRPSRAQRGCGVPASGCRRSPTRRSSGATSTSRSPR